MILVVTRLIVGISVMDFSLGQTEAAINAVLNVYL